MKLRIFVIDDEQCITDTFNWHLSEQGHEVVCVAEPTSCSVYQGGVCDHEHPCGDILFVDKNMPKMTGLEFVAHMKKKGCKGLTQNKVLMSGSLSQEEMEKAVELGCMVVNKPITLDQIDALIAEMKKVIHKDRKLADLPSD